VRYKLLLMVLKAVHNKRRFLKGGASTFERIVRGIDACLESQIPINLRMVADKENIDNLPELSQLAIDRRWTKSPWFKTQIWTELRITSLSVSKR